MMPLFVGSVEEASDGWMYWLLDSGAACLILSEANKEYYRRVSRGQDVSGRYLAGNGTPVQMGERVLASVTFSVERDDGIQGSQEFQLECNVGQTARNIISTTQLMKKGLCNRIHAFVRPLLILSLVLQQPWLGMAPLSQQQKEMRSLMTCISNNLFWPGIE